jgi:hypothetical protein
MRRRAPTVRAEAFLHRALLPGLNLMSVNLETKEPT